MTAILDRAAPQAPASRASRLTRFQRLALLGVGVFVVMSLTRVLTGASDINSSGTIGAAIGLAVPIGMAALGGLWAERSGVVNIGLEGMMIMGTWGAGWAGYQWGPWAALVAALGMGAIGGLIHAVATVTFGVDHIVSGVAINLLGAGITRYLAGQFFTGLEGAGASQSPPIPAIWTPSLLPSGSEWLGITGSFPDVQGWLLEIEQKGWFLISDAAALVRGLTYQVSAVTLVAILCIVASSWILWRTAFGLRLRSCGEDPYAAESLGVKVLRYKYIAVIVSGVLAGLGGAYLAINAGQYRENQTGGRGFIGLAAMIFGNWRPGGLATGAGLFGFTDALQLRQGGVSVHALLLPLSVGLILWSAWRLYRAARLSAAAALIVGLLIGFYFLTTDTVPSELTTAAPYITTLAVLAVASQRLRPPAADGLRYRKGSDR